MFIDDTMVATISMSYQNKFSPTEQVGTLMTCQPAEYVQNTPLIQTTGLIKTPLTSLDNSH